MIHIDNNCFHCIDDMGYKYRISKATLQEHHEWKKRKQAIYQSNPFATENIKLYMKLNYPAYKVLDFNYVSADERNIPIVCEKHGGSISMRTANDIVYNGRLCPECGSYRRADWKKITDEEASARANELGVNFVSLSVVNKRTRVSFTCPDHLDKGVFSVVYYEFLRQKHKCKYCANKAKDFEIVSSLLYSKNPDIKVEGIFYDMSSVLSFTCNKCGNKWTDMAKTIMKKPYCPECELHGSSGERGVIKYLKLRGISLKTEHTFKDCRDRHPLPFDIYLPDYNTLIEYDGEQHYFPVTFAGDHETAKIAFQKCKEHDAIKNDYCRSHGINLIRIPYWEKDNIDSYLDDKLKDVVECIPQLYA